MPEFDGISEYVKSGLRRLRDAEELLQPPTLYPQEQGAGTRHLRGAVYLAGYGVECLLKAYLISRQRNCARLSEARDVIRASGLPIRDICGEAGHDLRYLLRLTDLEASMNPEKRWQMSLSAKWSSSWRYDPRPVSREDAEARIEAARSLVDWIYTQI
jgi:hypothetical protein